MEEQAPEFSPVYTSSVRLTLLDVDLRFPMVNTFHLFFMVCLKSCLNLSYDKFKSHLKLSCLHPLKWSQSLVLLLVLVDFDLIVF